MAKVALVSLGCPKNLVDSEQALAELVGAGHELVVDQSVADVIVVNTCGFIESARAESIEAILEAVELKKSGKCAAVVVVGCLSQRFGKDLAAELPEVDAVLGIDHVRSVGSVVRKALENRRTLDFEAPPSEWVERTARIRATQPWTAYVKISDGCDNRCAYCAIPDIRGPFRSRPEGLIIDEARRLADEGVKEIILVGQDLTQYGEDLGRPKALPGLLEKLDAVEALRWIRVMYCYPAKVTPELIDAIASLKRVVKYLDLPMQHGDPEVLRLMNRRGTPDDYMRVISSLREKCPEIALRTSLIVGFPGESEAAFRRLLEFVKQIEFDRVGAFAYSSEEGTPAARMKKQVGRRTAQARLDELMALQQAISLERSRKCVGRSLEVLVEGRVGDGVYGRSYRDAPEIDGIAHVRGCDCEPGEFVDVRVTGADVHDLECEILRRASQ